VSVLDPEMYDAVQRDCPEKKLGREARAVRILTLFDETPQKNSRRLILPICCVAASVSTRPLPFHCC
jgi:hypothetical protein